MTANRIICARTEPIEPDEVDQDMIDALTEWLGCDRLQVDVVTFTEPCEDGEFLTALHRDGVDDERWTKVLWRHYLNFGVVKSIDLSN